MREEIKDWLLGLRLNWQHMRWLTSVLFKRGRSSSQESTLIEMQARFFVLMAVGDESSNHVNDKIDRTAMARMLDLRNILELINNRLDNRPFAQQELVREMHQPVFHVFTQPGHELKPLFKEQLRERSRNVAAISKELATQVLDHRGHRFAIINVAWRQAAGQQF